MGEIKPQKEWTVRFFSPGTFVAEQSVRDLPSFDIPLAVNMAKEIRERHGAIPYGFVIDTWERPPKVDGWEFERKHVEKSGMYYLGHCKIETLDDVRKRAEPKEKILLQNMECNGWDRIVVSTKGWRWTQPFEKGDHIVDAEGNIVE